MGFWVDNYIFLWICLFWPTSSKKICLFLSIKISRGTPSDISRNPRVPRNPGWETLVYFDVKYIPSIWLDLLRQIISLQLGYPIFGTRFYRRPSRIQGKNANHSTAMFGRCLVPRRYVHEVRVNGASSFITKKVTPFLSYILHEFNTRPVLYSWSPITRSPSRVNDNLIDRQSFFILGH
jgi:hypothetical protein